MRCPPRSRTVMHDCSSSRDGLLYNDGTMTAMNRLGIPMAIAVTVLAGGATIAAIPSGCGGGESPPFDANANCQVFCVYEGSDNGNCPFPTCATGSDLDQCPTGCIPEPIV